MVQAFLSIIHVATLDGDVVIEVFCTVLNDFEGITVESQ